MKRYKLKKWYPSLPKGWETGIILCLKDKTRGYSPCNGDYLSLKLDKNEVEQNPEFWEEIVEKDYEILSFYYKNVAGKGDNYVDPDYIWYETYKGSGLWSRKGNVTSPYTINELLNHNSFRIHSIKRLSDSQIFTIGDRISYINSLGSFILQQIEFECAPSDKNTGRLTFIHDHKTLGKWLNLKDLKKVVEQDFEILKFHDGFNEYYKIENGNFTINFQYKYTIDALLDRLINKKDLKIYSVKRLSDGEIFTIGDKVCETFQGTIVRFEIDDLAKSGLAVYTDKWITEGYDNVCISVIKKNKILFTTEDGVNIYKNDKFYFVSENFNNLKYVVENYASEGYYMGSDMKTFSTKEIAEKYILLNTPILTYQDIKNFDNIIYHHIKVDRDVLEELVKSKLNLKNENKD